MDIINEVVKQIDIKGNQYDVAIVREFECIDVIIDVLNGTTVPIVQYESSIKFVNKFLLEQIITRAETNALAGFLLKHSGNLLPSITYFADASNDLVGQPLGANTLGFYCTTTLNHYRDLNIMIEKDGKLELLVYNTHSSPQKLYLHFLGYRLYEKVLKRIP